MAKSLVLNILVDILGNYVEDLTKDNLKLAVWSGTIELFNLKLKSSALDKLNLPVKVVRGCLKKLQLKIPWTNLESKPVSVIMDGMYLETGPVDLSEISTADAKRMVAKSRQKKMEKAERAIMAVIHNKGYKRKKKASYIKQLTAKIIDNLEISLTNLHIRYEDQDSIPGTIISCGVTIESVTLQTTDEQWNPAYYNREGDKSVEDAATIQKRKLTGIHKLGQLKNLAVYWNSAHSAYTKSLIKKAMKPLNIASSAPVTPVTPGHMAPPSPDAQPIHANTEDEHVRRVWERKMQSLIYTDSAEAADTSAAQAGINVEDHSERETLDTMKYLLRPPNKVTVRVVHRELCTETAPNMDLTITCSQLQSKLVDDQYRQLRTLRKVLKGLDRRKLMLYHRPSRRPGADPRAWWHYAYFLATGNYPIRRGKMEVLSDCIAAKRYLVPFWKRNLVNREVIADQVFMQPSDFLESDLAPEIKAMELEEHLPITALIALRQFAAQEAVIEIKRLRASPAEMKRYVDEHHLDPEKEGNDQKGKFWGIGKITKLGKKNEFEDFIPGEKKKKGILKLLFKKKKKHTAEGDESLHDPDGALSEPGSPDLAASKRKGLSRGVGSPENSAHGGSSVVGGVTAKLGGSAVGGNGASVAERAKLSLRAFTKKARAAGGDDTDGEAELSDPDEAGDGDGDVMMPLEGDIDIERALGMHGEGDVHEAGDGDLEGDGFDGDEGDEEKLMEELRAALVKSSLDADQAFTLRIKIATSLTLRVNLGAQTIVTVVVSVRFAQEKRRNLQRFILELDNLSIRDMVSPKPLFKYIMSTDKSLVNSKVLKRASILQTTGNVAIPAIHFDKTDKAGEGFTEGAAQLNLLFEKKKGDSVEKGNSTLNIRTAPMQVVWNELCIRQLLLCFASKSTASDIDMFVQSAVERNKLLSQGIKKFKAELSAPSYKNTLINMEIFSPCVLIPEKYDEDRGCVRLDTGKLLIQGRKGYAGMSLQLQLLSVNIGIPQKIAGLAKPAPLRRTSGNADVQYQGSPRDSLHRTRSVTDADDNSPTLVLLPDTPAGADGSYLIKPFDINVSLDKFTHNKIGDTVLKVAVSPRIDAHLDSLNLIRLNYIMKNMLQSLKKQKDPTEAAAKKLAKKAEKDRKKKKAEQRHEDGEVEINYLRQLVFCQFSLPSAHVSLSLSPEHTVDFTVHAIALKYISRVGDTRCVLGVESLTLMDSMRPRNHRAIIWTADGHHSTHFSGPNSPEHTAPTAAFTPKPVAPHHNGLDLRMLFSPVDEQMYDSDEENARKDPADHPIVFSFTSINTVQSPLFQGIQKDIGINWGGICANIDNQSVERFGPFLSEMLNNVKTYQAVAEEHGRMVSEFQQVMVMAALDATRTRSISNLSTAQQAPTGGLMSPGGTVLPANVSARSRGGSLRPTSANVKAAAIAAAAAAAPTPQKDPKIGPSRLTFSARSMTLDILQEHVLPTEEAPVSIDSSVAFAAEEVNVHDHEAQALREDFERDRYYDQRHSISAHSEDFGRDASPLEDDELILPEEGGEPDEEDNDLEEEEEEERLESAFRLHFGNIFFQMLSKEDEKEINAHMTTFTLKDVRHSSQKFVFNTLLSRSDKQQALQTEAASNVMRLEKRAKEAAEHLLRVKFVRQTKALMDIEVVLQDITSYVSVDIFLAFAALANENVKAAKAVKKIIKANKKKNAEPTLKTKLALESYLKTKRKQTGGEAPPISEKKIVRNLSIIVLNPRLFVLENPEDFATKAIVSDCKINFFIVRETLTFQYVDHERVEVKDSLHLSLRDFQLFVWTNIQEQSMPHQIIEPAGVDIHFVNATENDVCLLKHFKCSTDNFRGRVSLNDVVLTTSILARAKLTQGKKKKKVKGKKSKKLKKGAKAPTEQPEGALIFVALTMYKIDLNIGRISLVLLNDFNNQNVPLFKMCIDQSDFNAEGSKQHMEGSGSLLFSADNYNLPATCWEPIIEPWQPTLLFTKDFNGTRFTLQSENTLQLNITGIFCNSIHRSKALVAKIGKAGAYGTQRTIFPLIVRNQLGVPIELYDSRSKESILKLTDDSVHAVPSKTVVSTVIPGGGNSSEQLRSETYADLFDIHLLGPESTKRLPILQAPLTAMRPKRYIFRHVERQQFHYEPIQEELYENERYNPLRRAWVTPWMSFDYPHWSDSRGNEVCDPEDFVLPLNWRWADSGWSPCVGVVGVETDEHGWHYESNFVQFSACRYVRRAQQPLDVVRRRRLVRIRAPRVLTAPGAALAAPISLAAALSETASEFRRPRSNSRGSTMSAVSRTTKQQRLSAGQPAPRSSNSKPLPAIEEPPPMPLVVFWEVVTKADESREIIISSGLHVRNEGPCELEIELLNAEDDEGELDDSSRGGGGSDGDSATENPNILRIDENKSLGVPLSLSNSDYMRIRPVAYRHTAYEWSENINCKLRSDQANSSEVSRVCCRETHNPSRVFYFTIRLEMRERQLTVTCSANVLVFNGLPCPVIVRCVNSTLLQPQVSSMAAALLAEEETGLVEVPPMEHVASQSGPVPSPPSPPAAPPVPPAPSTPPAVPSPESPESLETPKAPPLPITPPPIPSVPPPVPADLPPPPPVPTEPPAQSGSPPATPAPALPSTPPPPVPSTSPPSLPAPALPTPPATPPPATRPPVVLTPEDVYKHAPHLKTLEPTHLLPGTTTKIPRLSLQHDIEVFLELAGHHSTIPLHLNNFERFADREEVVWLSELNEDGTIKASEHDLSSQSSPQSTAGQEMGVNMPGLKPLTPVQQGAVERKQFSVIVRAEVSETGVLNLFIYAQYLLVDQTNSRLVVHSEYTEEALHKVNRMPLGRKKPKTTKPGKSPKAAASALPSSTALDKEGADALDQPTKYMPDASIVKVVERCTYQGKARSAWKTIADQFMDEAKGDITECWPLGKTGVTMFQSGRDNTISLGVNGGGGWCRHLPLDSLGKTKFPLEIHDENTKDNYNIALTMTPIKNTSVSTQLLRVVPCYTIVNYLDEGIEILHPNDTFLDHENGNFFVASKSSRPWHRLAHFADTTVRIRCDKSTASVGTIDLNEIGTTMVVLPRFKYDENFRGEDLIIAHVEVKFSEADSPSYITVVIWRSLMKFGPDMEVLRSSCAYLSVRNETDFPFTIQQQGVQDLFVKAGDPEQQHKFDLNIMPGQWLPYGWTDPKLGKTLVAYLGVLAHGSPLPSKRTPSVMSGASGSGGTRRHRGAIDVFPSCVVDTGQVNKVSVMDLTALHDPMMVNISFVMKTLGNGLVLCIYKSNELLGTGAKKYFKGIEAEGDASAVGVARITKEVDDRRKTMVVKMQLQGISVSLVAEVPQRRELLGVFIDKFETTFRKAPESAKEGAMTSVEVKVRDIQVDNYSESTVFPVLLTSMHSSEREQAARQYRLARIEGEKNGEAGRQSSSSPPTATPNLQIHTQQQTLLQRSLQQSDVEEYPCFLQFTAAKEAPKGRGKVDAIIKYVGLRVLEVKLAVDSSSLIMYYLDLVNDLISDSASTSMDNSDEVAVRLYYQDLNAEVSFYLLKKSGLNSIDPEFAFRKAQVRKYFFETVVIHPLKFTLTFTPTSLPRFQEERVFEKNKKLKLLQAGSGIPDIENFEVRLNSFIVHHAMESMKTMKARIANKVKSEVKSNLLLIGGNLITSMNIIGKPAGLLKNVGGGVQAFFYEPYLGSLEGPSAFARGVGKGTGALFGGVASGIVGYTASLVGTASSGVSLMARGVVAMSSGEDEDKFLQSRETKRRQFKASGGGVLSGLKQGGIDLFSGVASGVKGLVTKPMQEGKKSGALGVMRGMGMGIVGVVVKPVLGLSDGVTSVAAGFTQQMLVDQTQQAKHARPPRALERANPISGKLLVLLPMDVFAAKAQHFLKTVAGQQNEYLASCTLGYQLSPDEFPDAEYGLLLSTTHIYLLTASVQMVWAISFSELSHIVLKRVTDPNKIDDDATQTGVVGFVLYGCSLAVTKTVTCANRIHALRVYGFMQKFAYRMGNPTAIVPLDSLIAEATAVHAAKPSRVRTLNLDEYIFGYANNMKLPINIVTSLASEAHLIETARDKFLRIFCTDTTDKDAVYFYYRLLDEAMFTLAMEWKHSHMLKLTPSHCCVCLLLNSCPSYAPVQVLDLELIEGRNYTIFSCGDNYDPVARTIAPCGGAMVIFAYGHPPSLNDAPTVKLQIKTTAFTATLSSRTGEPNCVNHNGFTAGYLEKARSDYWSKSVINITLLK